MLFRSKRRHEVVLVMMWVVHVVVTTVTGVVRVETSQTRELVNALESTQVMTAVIEMLLNMFGTLLRPSKH